MAKKNTFLGCLFDNEEEEDFDGQSFLPCTVDELRAETLESFLEDNDADPSVLEAIRDSDMVCFGKSDKLDLTWVEVAVPVEGTSDDTNDAADDVDDYEFAIYVFGVAK